MSAAAHPQSQVDFLKGEVHRKHPGVTNMKTLRMPEELQTAARSIIHSKLLELPSSSIRTCPEIGSEWRPNLRSLCLLGAQVTRLTERTRELTNFLWSRKRPVENATLRKKAMSLEKELWERAMEKRGGKCCTNQGAMVSAQ